MVQAITTKHASVIVAGAKACPYLESFVDRHEVIQTPASSDLELSSSTNGLELIWNVEQRKPLHFHLDFEKVAKQYRSFPAPKQGAFNQALGKRTKNVIDASGGWGGDALLMCLQGYQVSVVERLPLMATLLEEAFSRFARSSWAVHNGVKPPSVVHANASDILTERKFVADCVYLDPMFPPKRKKTAIANKYMQLLQWLAGADGDAKETAEIAIANYSRLAVKRPDYAQPLMEKPAVQFSSKLVHYDVYLSALSKS